jgi:hypothetical protein
MADLEINRDSIFIESSATPDFKETRNATTIRRIFLEKFPLT